VSTIGSDEAGQAYNINADTVAGAIAEAVNAEKIVYLTDVEGLLHDAGDPSSLISRVSPKELQALIDSGSLTGGMIPKIAACVHAVEHGVRSAHIVGSPSARAAARAFHGRGIRRHDHRGSAEERRVKCRLLSVE
jgi:acetylglutamate kinase